jgi:hypothetical protein
MRQEIEELTAALGEMHIVAAVMERELLLHEGTLVHH